MHSAEFELTFNTLSSIRNTVSEWVARYHDKRLSNYVLITSEIVTNLLKHSEPKPVSCFISLDKSTDFWCLKIYDNGGEFIDFNNTISTASKEFTHLQESGMGLRLLKTLADDIQYKPEYESDRAGYHCYIFYLRFEQRKTIAVIDDDISILTLLEAYLESDYRLFVFNSGQAAIDGLAGKNIDLVISDLNMPEVDGLQLRKSLQGSLGNLPFIFLTGENSDQLHRLAIDDVLSKPIHKQALLQSIERVLIRYDSLQQSISNQLSPAIVKQLLPRIKYQPQGFQILISARAAHSGGGDFVFQKQQETGSLILLADVMGHDQQAKFFVHAYQGFLQGVCHGLKNCNEPQALLYALSNGLREDELLSSSLLTAVSIFCSNNGSIYITSAGHPAPKVLLNNQWQSTPVSGQLLGFSDTAIYEAYECPKGLPVACFTDGLEENLSESEQEEFFKLLSESISASNPCLSQAMDYYDNKAGVPASDDMTVMVIIPE